jgi:phosphoglycolate phosphatase
LKGIRSLLTYLKNTKHEIGIFSSDSLDNIENILVEKNIKKYFDVILDSNGVEKSKPHPKGLLKIAKKLEVDPTNCAYMGDSKYDMIAAKRAKMKRIGISTGFYSKNQLKLNGAQITVSNHKELLDILKLDKTVSL